METPNNNIPKLRFPEFSEEWEITYLKNIARFSKGKNIAKSDIVEDGEIECIRYGELYTYYNEVIANVISKTNLPRKDLVFSQRNDIIIPSSGETQIDIAKASCVLKDNIALGGDLNIIRTSNDGIFISFYLNNTKRKEIASLAQGNSVVHLYADQLKGLQLKLPSLPEQQKIAAFLSATDKKIEQLTKKKKLLEQYKKGLMQQIFSQMLRFKPEGGGNHPDWEEKKLGNLCHINKGIQLNVESLTKEGIYPCVNGGVLASGYTDNFNRPENTITISEGGNSCGFVNFFTTKFWSGGHCYTLDNMAEVIFKSFLFQFLKYNETKIMGLRVGSGLPNIQKRELLDFRVELPCIEEQTQIANFLQAIDAKIELANNQIENARRFKKGLLQQMFV